MRLSRRSTFMSASIAAAVAFSLSVAPPATADQQTTYTVVLSGDQVVDGPGDPDGFGTATITVDHKAEQACIAVDTTNIHPNFNGVTIDEGFAGEPMVTGWAQFGTGFYEPDPANCNLRHDNISFKALWHMIEKDPEGFHLTIRNAEYPDGGAIRGQLSPQAK